MDSVRNKEVQRTGVRKELSDQAEQCVLKLLRHLKKIEENLSNDPFNLYPTSNLTIQNSYLTAIIPAARDRISNFLQIAEFLLTKAKQGKAKAR